MRPATGSAVAAAIADATGERFAPTECRAVGGGSIHRACVLDDGARRFFIKLNDAGATPMFAAEADGLRALAAAAVLRTPTVVARGEADGEAFLVLEYLELHPLDAAAGARLGGALADLHRVRGARHGWDGDNFIGATPQCNVPHADWGHFFGERRLRPQFERARGNGMESALVRQGEALIGVIGGLFLDHRPVPSLLHGDLWSGNAACGTDGAPVLFDPACYYGDRETDLAMAELFGGFPTSVYAAYRAAWPLDSGYEQRKAAYALYHVLNHFNLFGDAYLGQARRLVERLLKDLRR